MKLKTIFFFFLFVASIIVRAQSRGLFELKSIFLEDFEIQTKEGLIRLDTYEMANDWELQSYWKLIELKYLLNDFKEIDLDIVGNKPQELIASRPNSHISVLLSNFIIDMSAIFSNDKAHVKYGKMWSIDLYTDYPRLKKSYKSFIEDNLDVLKNKAKVLWKDDYEIAYLVRSAAIKKNRVSKYDFSNNGYWLEASPGASYDRNLNLKNNDFIYKKKTFRFSSVGHLPKKDFEKDLTDVLFEYPASDAEKLEVKTPLLFLVQKIKIYLIKKDVSVSSIKNMDYGNILQFGYQLVNPTMEIYADVNLTDKVGEISLEDALFKN